MKASWDGVPAYRLIARKLREQIVSGHLSPGSRMPTAEVIADTWRVSRGTATKAVQLLRSEGLAELRPGSGTFVIGRATTSVMLLPGDKAVVTRANGSVEHVAVTADQPGTGDDG